MKTKTVKLTAAWAVTCIALLGLFGCDAPKTTPVEAEKHEWGQWTEPKETGDWFNGRNLYQTRICKTCGMAERRYVQIPTTGDAKP